MLGAMDSIESPDSESRMRLTRRPMSLFRTGVVAGAVALIAVASLAGCGQGRPAEPSRDKVLASLVDEARNANADSSQLTILARGEVSWEDYSASMRRWIECTRAAGVETSDDGIDTSAGYPVLNVGFIVPSPNRTKAQTQEVIEACEKRYSYWVNYSYQTSAAAVAGTERVEADWWSAHRREYLTCLRTHGARLADDVTLQQAVTEEARLRKADPQLPCRALAPQPGESSLPEPTATDD